MMLIQVTWITFLLTMFPFVHRAESVANGSTLPYGPGLNVDYDDPVAASIALATQEKTPALNSNVLWEVWSEGFKFNLPVFSFFQSDYWFYSSMITLLYGCDLPEPKEAIVYPNESPSIRFGNEFSYPSHYVPSIWDLLRQIPLRVARY